MSHSTGLPTVLWANSDRLIAAADMMSSVILLDASYVSHGEIQTGLSLDGKSWAPDLAEKMRSDFANLTSDRRVALALVDDELVGVAVALFQQDERARYVVLEDVAVAPKARSYGVGSRLIDFIETEARELGFQWAFLESGLANEGAHALFERKDYRPISKVFCKSL